MRSDRVELAGDVQHRPAAASSGTCWSGILKSAIQGRACAMRQLSCAA